MNVICWTRLPMNIPLPQQFPLLISHLIQVLLWFARIISPQQQFRWSKARNSFATQMKSGQLKENHHVNCLIWRIKRNQKSTIISIISSISSRIFFYNSDVKGWGGVNQLELDLEYRSWENHIHYWSSAACFQSSWASIMYISLYDKMWD